MKEVLAQTALIRFSHQTWSTQEADPPDLPVNLRIIRDEDT
jgi:hypothetical protein